MPVFAVFVIPGQIRILVRGTWVSSWAKFWIENGRRLQIVFHVVLVWWYNFSAKEMKMLLTAVLTTCCLYLRKPVAYHSSHFFLIRSERQKFLDFDQRKRSGLGSEPETVFSTDCDIVAWESVFLFEISSEWNSIAFLTS